MTQIESPKRKMQKQNDYQRHKLFRKIKRRRKAQAEAQQEVAEKQLKKKLKLPKFGDGKSREVYTKDIHFNDDDSAGGIDRYGNKFDFVELPEVVATARRIPTFKDIEKQIGRKITQDEIDKVVAVDPEIPIQLPNTPKEKGLVQPSITNEVFNTIVGSTGDAINYAANKAGLPNLTPSEQFIETKDGDALFDLPGYGQIAKAGLYGLGRYGGKLGLKKLQNVARRQLLDREFASSRINGDLANEITHNSINNAHVAQLPKATLKDMSDIDADLHVSAEAVQLPDNLSPLRLAHNNSQIVKPDGSIDVRNIVRARQQLRQLYPNADDPKKIFNHDFLTPKRTNLNQHIAGVVKTAQDIPVPTGYTRQDLVQAALGHDIGKVIDARQGQHEQISADMLINAMRQNGFIGTQDIKPDVIQAIAEHGLGDKAVDLDPLTQALHVADVTRGASYDQAAIHAGYLFNYPREYPKWNFQNKPLRDEIIQNINPVLKRQGYSTINPNSTLEEAKDALNSVIDEHRTFVRGVYDKGDAKAQSYMLTDEPISQKVANGGRRGLSKHRSFYGVPQKRYDGLYLSTNADFLNMYGHGGNGGKVGIVKIPQNEISKTSDNLSERLLAGDFDVYNSMQVNPGTAGNPQSSWTLFGEPYRLQTGRSLRSDMIEKDPNVPKVKGEYVHNSGQVLAHMKPRDLEPSFGDWFELDNYKENQPTYGQMVDRINKSLEDVGLTNVKSFASTDKNGEVENIFFNNGRGIEHINETINTLDELQQYAEIAKPYLKDEKKLRERLSKLDKEFMSNWDQRPELIDEIKELEYKVNQIDLFQSKLNALTYACSPKQMRIAKHSGDLKYIKRPVLKMALDDYFDGIKKTKGHVEYKYKDQEKYLNNPENQAAFMRRQGVLPRYDHPTYNHIFAITPGEHVEDMPRKMATKNKPLGPGQIAVIDKRGKRVVDLVKELSPEEVKDIYEKTKEAEKNSKLKKPSGKKNYRDTGDRIVGIKLSRKALQ